MRSDEHAWNESQQHPAAPEHHGQRRRRVSANWRQPSDSQPAQQRLNVPNFSRPLTIPNFSRPLATYQPRSQTLFPPRSSSLPQRLYHRAHTRHSEDNNDHSPEHTRWQPQDAHESSAESSERMRRWQDAHDALTQSPVAHTNGGLWTTDRYDFATNAPHYPSPAQLKRESQLLGGEGIAPDEIARRRQSDLIWASPTTAVDDDEGTGSKKRWSWKRISWSSQKQYRRWPSFHKQESTQRARSFDLTRDVKRRLSTISLPDTWTRKFSVVSDDLLGRNGRQSIVSRMTEGVFAPTEEEVATFYATPGPGAFNLDAETGLAPEQEPVNPARNLTRKELLHQRLVFGSIVFALNVACIVTSAVGYSGVWVLCVILFFKSKDFLSVWIQVFCRIYYAIKNLFVAPPPRKAAWILSLIPAYSESEEQIVKTLFSLRDNGTGEHRQVMCIILDGKPRPIKEHMTKVVASFERKYVSLKWKVGMLKIDAGFVDDIPTLCIEKSPNAGKKDSLVLCHDLFNHPRANIDQGVLRLREELWTTILPQLTKIPNFEAFDLVFCTDADSTIHQGALALLADACLADPNAIAACGFVFVEYEPGLEWSIWNLYQQFQYSFGQIVRRGAEHFIGKVTCLPGCITMIVVRPEMAGAIQKYAKPVTDYPVLSHQVQYLGTDRRLTYSMLSQGKHLHTLFVPEAGSETVAPQSLKHYLSQRRRWGSNAYFNNYFYFAGENMIAITRIAALIEITRLSMVYYRVFNTGLFLYGVATNFRLMKILPLLAISFTPSFWFAFVVAFLNGHLRRNWHKLLCGFCINRCISPFMSITVFSLVARNLGSQAVQAIVEEKAEEKAEKREGEDLYDSKELNV